MAKKGKVVWIPKGAFVMPVLPKSLKIDPILASLLHMMAFLELSDDDTVDPDWAVEAMEHVAHYMQQLADDHIKQVQEQLDRVATHAKKKQMPREFIELAQDFLECCGVGEDVDE